MDAKAAMSKAKKILTSKTMKTGAATGIVAGTASGSYAIARNRAEKAKKDPRYRAALKKDKK